MTGLINHWFPWLADLLELGGPILGLILLLALVIWALLFERVYFLRWVYPDALAEARALWRTRGDKTSWYAEKWRVDLVSTLNSALAQEFSLIATLIKVCPLLGLLGTVMGMLEVFDALAATGSNNPRSMAAGVSKATVSTLAGMVVAIVGLLGSMVIERTASAERERLPSYFASNLVTDGVRK